MTGDNVLEINVSGFSAGLYIVKIEGATLSFSKRLYVYR